MSKKKIPDAPVWMSTEARTHYEWLAPRLIKENSIDEIDLPMVWAACEYYGRFRTVEKMQDKKSNLAAYEKIIKSLTKKSNMDTEDDGSSMEEAGREDDIKKAFEEQF